MRRLVYFASGNYYDRFEELPFDQIILIDMSAFRDDEHTRQGSKVECWNMSAIEALQEFKIRGIQIDALVILNEGFLEGGAKYPLLTNLFLGLVYPFLKNSFLFITDFEYYRQLNLPKSIFKLDTGFATKEKLDSTDPLYLAPNIFKFNYNRHGVSQHSGHVYRITKSNHEAEKQFGNITIRLVHGSIWSDEEQYEAIGLKLNCDQKSPPWSNNIVVDHIYKKPNVFFNDLKYLTDIYDYCINKKINKIALGPWLKNDYENFLKDLINNDYQTPLAITIYHQNSNDLRELYLSFGTYFLQAFPYLFENLKKDYPNWSYFEEALNEGVGKHIFALCEVIERYKEINPIEKKPYFRQVKVKFSDLKMHLSYTNDYLTGAVQVTRNIVYYELNKKK